jgi:membrane-associated phospholipid phosphatase
MRPSAGTSGRSGSDIPVKSGFRSLSPLDLATLFYLLGSALFIFAGWSRLEGVAPHLAIRILLAAGILALARLARRHPSPLFRFAHSVYPILFINYFYAETSYLKNILIGENLDSQVAVCEASLFGCQPSLSFSENFPSPWFNELMHLFYFSYYVLIIAVTVFLYLNAGEKGIRGIFIVFCSFYFYYIIFALLPVVGPQYFFQGPLAEVPRPLFFGKLMHFILQHGEEPTGAFPSSHVGIAIILAWLALKNLSRHFLVMIPFVLGICFATVYLKAHYLLDVIAGVLSAPLLYGLSAWLYKRMTRHHGTNE